VVINIEILVKMSYQYGGPRIKNVESHFFSVKFSVLTLINGASSIMN